MFQGRVRGTKPISKTLWNACVFSLLVFFRIQQDLIRDVPLLMGRGHGRWSRAWGVKEVIQATELKGWRHLK